MDVQIFGFPCGVFFAVIFFGYPSCPSEFSREILFMELHAIEKILHSVDDALLGSLDFSILAGFLVTRRQVTLARRRLEILVRDHAEIAANQRDRSRPSCLDRAAAAFARVLVALVVCQ